jgi:hypothetical protein
MKALARELIWFFIAVILASPIAYFFSYVMGLQPEGPELEIVEEVFQMEMFIIGGIIGFVCTYLMRVIIWATAKFLIQEEV